MSRGVQTTRTKPPDLAWLAQVREADAHLSEQHPIWMRHGTIYSGPVMSSPQRHPCCEFAMLLDGRGMQYVEGEEAEIRAGDIFVAGPGVPHLHRPERYPHRFATAYFLPDIFIGPGPGSDGPRVLRRIMARQPLASRLIRPPTAMRRRIERGLEEMIEEAERKRFGFELRLAAILSVLLIDLLRWEQATSGPSAAGPPIDWRPLDAAIRYLTAHFDQPVYARDVASAAGVGEAALKQLFHDALGMTWVHYLQGYRIHRAAAMLSDPRHNVTEAAFACGFESLSHFNATFRRFVGAGPKALSQAGKSKKNFEKR